MYLRLTRGWDCAVGIATHCGLDGPGIESRWGARLSANVQNGPGAHPASYTMGTGSFPGVKRLGRGVKHPTPSSTEVKERVELYLYSLSGPLWPVLGRTLPFTFAFVSYSLSLNFKSILRWLQPVVHAQGFLTHFIKDARCWKTAFKRVNTLIHILCKWQLWEEKILVKNVFKNKIVHLQSHSNMPPFYTHFACTP